MYVQKIDRSLYPVLAKEKAKLWGYHWTNHLFRTGARFILNGA
jgi:hypothetical protein